MIITPPEKSSSVTKNPLAISLLIATVILLVYSINTQSKFLSSNDEEIGEAANADGSSTHSDKKNDKNLQKAKSSPFLLSLEQLFRKRANSKLKAANKKRLLNSNEGVDLATEKGKMTKSLRTVAAPLKCKKSASLETSPYLLKKYGEVKDTWCEMKQSLGSAWKDELFNSSTIFSNGTTYVDYPSSPDGIDWPYYKCPINYEIKCNSVTPSASNENKNGTQVISNTAKKQKKTKALVIYIVSSGSKPYQVHQESINTDFFIRHGYIPANTPTALFDAVDFVFAKVQLGNEKTLDKFVDCGNLSSALGEDEDEEKKSPKTNPHSNVRFLMVNRVSCDLAAHAKILGHLKVFNVHQEQLILLENEKKNFAVYRSNFNGSSYLNQLFAHESSWRHRRQPEPEEPEYSKIIMMNSGVRGPFFSSADDEEEENHGKKENHQDGSPKTTWIDFVSMGGRRKIPNPRFGFFNDDTPLSKSNDCPFHVSVSSSISYERAASFQSPLHHQSYFLAMPVKIMQKRIFPLFANLLPSPDARKKRDKAYCINNGEIAIGKSVLDRFGATKNDTSYLPTAMYSLAKQYYVHNTDADATQKREFYYHPPKNPSYSWIDVCKSVFVKAGGEAFNNRQFPPEGVNVLNLLTKGADLKKMSKGRWHPDAISKMFDEKGCDWTF